MQLNSDAAVTIMGVAFILSWLIDSLYTTWWKHQPPKCPHKWKQLIEDGEPFNRYEDDPCEPLLYPMQCEKCGKVDWQ